MPVRGPTPFDLMSFRLVQRFRLEQGRRRGRAWINPIPGQQRELPES
jgi:hypothetical protein